MLCRSVASRCCLVVGFGCYSGVWLQEVIWSSSSVVMRSSASVLISIRGSVSEFMLSVFICGIVVVLLTLIVHLSSVVVAACRAPLEVDNPLV